MDEKKLRRQGLVSLILMVLTLVILNADQMIISPNINAIEKEFKVTDLEIGYITATFTIIGALISLIWGYLGDKFNRKMLLFYSVLIGTIPCFLSAFANSFEMLFVLRALTGIGVGAAYPLVYSMAGDMFAENKRAKAMAVIATSISVGQILGMVIAGYAGSISWRTPFLIVSIPLFIVIIFFLIFVKEPKRGSKEFAIGDLIEAGAEYGKKITFKDYFNLVSVRTNLMLFIQGILGTIPWGAIPYFLVPFLERERNIPTNIGTLIFIVFGIGNVLGILFGGMMGGKLFEKKNMYLPVFCGITTIIGAFMCFATLTYTGGNLIILGILGFFTAFTLSMTAANVKTMLVDVNRPENRARIFSVFNLTDALGTGIGQLFAGGISASVGSLGIALNIAAGFWIGCGILLIILGKIFQNDVENLKHYFQTVKSAMLKEKA